MEHIIIPDLHGQYNLLIKMLSKFIDIENGKITNNNKYKIIFLGDLIDKGSQEEQIKLINFIYDNMDQITLIYGNHDYKTYKKLTTDKDYFLSEFYDFYYETLILEENKIIKEKFMKIYENMVLYYEDDIVFCNHSPCLREHIEKKKKSLFQYQFNRQKETPDKEYKEYLYNFFKNVCNFNDYHKLHIFGHLGLEKPIKNNNQIWLDTVKVDSLTFLHIKDNRLTFVNDFNEINDFFELNNKESLNYIVESMFGFRKYKKEK